MKLNRRNFLGGLLALPFLAKLSGRAARIPVLPPKIVKDFYLPGISPSYQLTGGTFTLTIGGSGTTGPIAWNASPEIINYEIGKLTRVSKKEGRMLS